MEPDGDSPPFWPPTSTSVRFHRRRPSPPSFLSPVILILLLPILALLFIFFVVYPFLSHATQFLLGPTFSVKKSWDSLNVVLVIFAILCGVFARRKEEVPPAADRNARSSIGDRPAEPVLNSHYLNSTASVGPETETETARSSHFVYNTTTFESENETVSSSQWYDTSTTPVRPENETFRNGPWYDTTPVRPDIETIRSSQFWYNYNASGVGPEIQLMSSSSSYPDLRQGSFWNDGESRFRFDGLEVNNHNQSPAELVPVSDHFDGDGRRGKEDGGDPDDKVIPVDTFEVRSTPPASPPKSTPPPSPPPGPPIDFKQQRSLDNVQREEEDEKPRVVETNADDDQLKENRSPLPGPPPPPPEPPVSLKRSFHSVPRKKKVVKPSDAEAEMADDQLEENHQAPPANLPSPPLSPEVQQVPEESHPKPQRKKSGTAKELTNAISSFYNHQKKKKKSKKKIAEDSSGESSPHSTHSLPPQTPPPPPPPLPPPFKGFQNLFKKSSKSKRSQYSETSETTPPPPPPPPPPPNSIFNNIFKTGNRSKRFIPTSTSSSGPPPPPPPPPSSILNTLFKQGGVSNRFKSESSINKPPPPPPPPKQQVSSKQRKSKNKQSISPTPPSESMLPRTSTSGKPPLPAKSSMYSDEFLNSGSQSPLITKPPPLPPFTMAEFEFVASGDFVRIRSSTSSSWCSSPGPGREDFDDVTDQMEGSDTVGPSVSSCPSPDVNVKADTFISRLKDEWRLEKMNSIKKNPLGPSPK